MKVIRQGIRDLFSYRDIDIYRDLSWRERKALDIHASVRALSSAEFWYLILGIVAVSLVLEIVASYAGLASWRKPIIVMLCLAAVAPVAATARKRHVQNLIAERHARQLPGSSSRESQE